jgi:hypothetical protein
MQAHDLVVNLYGETPSTPPTALIAAYDGDAVAVLNAEALFLPTLHNLHTAPKHATTWDALTQCARVGQLSREVSLHITCE